MAKRYVGKLVGEGLKFGVIVSRFNEFITGKLLDGAQDTLARHGVKEADVERCLDAGLLRDTAHCQEDG